MVFGELLHIQVGNLAAKPSFKKNPDGSTVVNFRLITNSGWRDASGETKERAEGFNFELWGPSAQRFSELDSGDEVYVRGEPRNHSWEPGGGEPTRYGVRIVVSNWRAFNKKLGKQSEGTGEGTGDDGPAF